MTLDLDVRLHEGDVVLPDYRNSNLAEVKRFASGDARRKVLFVVDGFGMNLLEKVLKKDDLLRKKMSEAKIKRVTTLFPSVTPSILTSLDSGLSIAEHGIVGDTIPVKEAGALVNPLTNVVVGSNNTKLEASVSKFIFPAPMLLSRMAKERKLVILTSEDLSWSIYAKSLYAGKPIIPYKDLEGLFASAVNVMNSGAYEYIYIYLEELDKLQHKYSPDSEEVESFVRELLFKMCDMLFRGAKENDYEVLVTADHGHITIKAEDILGLEPSSEIMNSLKSPPWGSYRYNFFDVKEGKDSEFLESFERVYGERAVLLKSEDAIEKGLFGARTVKGDLRYRFGKYIAIGKDRNFIYFLYPGKRQWWKDPKWSRTGVHGGMHPDEMYVPVITI